jgi:hypothetical protein
MSRPSNSTGISDRGVCLRLDLGGGYSPQAMVPLDWIADRRGEEAVCLAFQARGIPLSIWGSGELRVPPERLEEAELLLRIVHWKLVL